MRIKIFCKSGRCRPIHLDFCDDGLLLLEDAAFRSGILSIEGIRPFSDNY